MTKPDDLPEQTAADYKKASDEHRAATERLDELGGILVASDPNTTTPTTAAEKAQVKDAMLAELATHDNLQAAFKAWANARGFDL